MSQVFGIFWGHSYDSSMNKLLVRKRTGWGMVGAIAGISTIIALLYRPHFLTQLINKRTDHDVLFRIPTDQKIMALTIDDGPHSDTTPQILDLLDEYDAHATFFTIGERVAGNEAILQRLVADGHELGNHLMRDARSIQLAPEEFEKEVADTHDLLAPYGKVRWFRPGSGFYNQRMLNHIRQYNYELVLGSVYPYDAQLPYPQFLSRYILNNAQAGGIIILHDGTPERGARTVEVLGEIMPALQAQGYRLVTLSELVEKGN
jgi:peptidoglycan/xylan/chitin deacetylase (PgdA/CDA1 family)